MENKHSIPFLKKLSVTLLCILGSAGVIYFFDSFKNFNANKADQFFWIILFGISLAYILGYKLEIGLRKTKKN
jgi:hypothetical protein